MSDMIPRNSLLGQQSWQKELADVITDPVELLKMLAINPEDYFDDIKARQLFPVRVPRPFADRIEKGNPRDPLLLQVMPKAQEFLKSPGYVTDPLQEQQTVAPGMLHKYESRVLFILKGGCAVNCRYCFRRHFPYAETKINKRDIQVSLEYLEQHPEINEVILSGGDPLMANDDFLQWMLEKLEAIPHLTRIRIHTRLPVVIPARITQKLLTVLSSSRLQALIVLHINHANEIDGALKQACKDIREAGIHLLNQSVLLKDVNDKQEALINLSEALFEAGVMPYYLHLLDKVEGAEHFDISEREAVELVQSITKKLPGFLVPRLAREEPGKPSKTLININ